MPHLSLKLSIVVPVFDEQATIEATVRKVGSAPLPTGWTKEVILVDDGSTDGSREILKRLAKTYKVIFRPRNEGKGAALKDGLRAATGDYILIQDADNEYDTDDYSRLLTPIAAGAAQVVFGSRVLKTNNVPFNRVYFYGGLVLTKLFDLLFGGGLTDLATCYKVFPRAFVDGLVVLPANDFVFDVVELSHFLLRHGPIHEVPIRYASRHTEDGKKLNWRHGWRCFWRIVSLRIDDLFVSPARVRQVTPIGRSTSEKAAASAENERMVNWHAVNADFEFAALKEARNYRRALIREMSHFLTGRVIEVGSGVGQMTESLRRLAGIRELQCLEPDAGISAEFRRRLPGQALIEGTAANVKRNDWDAIVSANVLEHIERDEDELKAYARLLHLRGGALCLFVPARPELFAQIDEDFGHFRRYTKKGLKTSLERAGFAVEKIRYYNFSGYFAWGLMFRLLRRRAFNGKAVRLYDRLVFPVMNFLETAVCSPPFGQSLFVVARARKGEPNI